LRWSPRPLRGAPPAAAWGAAAAVGDYAGGTIGGGGPPMLSPFFRLSAPPPVTPVADFGEVAPVRPLIGLGSHSGCSGFPELSPPMAGGGDPCAATWLAGRAAGTDLIPGFQLLAPLFLNAYNYFNFKLIKQSCSFFCYSLYKYQAAM